MVDGDAAEYRAIGPAHRVAADAEPELGALCRREAHLHGGEAGERLPAEDARPRPVVRRYGAILIVEDLQGARALFDRPLAESGAGGAVEDGVGGSVHLNDSPVRVVHHHAVHHGVEGGLDLAGTLGHLALEAPLDCQVARDGDGADDRASGVPEGRGAHFQQAISSRG